MKVILVLAALLVFPVVCSAQQRQQTDETQPQDQMQPLDPVHFCYFAGLPYSVGAELNNMICKSYGNKAMWDYR